MGQKRSRIAKKYRNLLDIPFVVIKVPERIEIKAINTQPAVRRVG